MNEEEKKAIEIANSLKEWGKIHFFVRDRSYARLTYNEVYLISNLIEKLQKENEEWKKAYQEEKDKQFELIQNTNNTIKTANIAIKDLQEKLKEVIPVQKVKDKMEKLNKEIKNAEVTEAIFKIKQQQVLQELLEKED